MKASRNSIFWSAEDLQSSYNDPGESAIGASKDDIGNLTCHGP